MNALNVNRYSLPLKVFSAESFVLLKFLIEISYLIFLLRLLIETSH